MDVDARQHKGYEGQYRSQEQSAKTAPGSLNLSEEMGIAIDQIMESDRLNLIA